MENNIICYRLSGHDNDSYMLGKETRKAITSEEREYFDWRFTKNGAQHPATCQKCGRKTDKKYIDSNFELQKRNMDISSTFDGYTIVSKKFKLFCENHTLQGLEFIDLPSQPNHYWLVVHNILKVDITNSLNLRLLFYCDKCACYAGVFGTSHLQFKNFEHSLSKGIYRTDLEFAQAHEQHPVFIVSSEIASAMKTEKLKGMCLNKCIVNNTFIGVPTEQIAQAPRTSCTKQFLSRKEKFNV